MSILFNFFGLVLMPSTVWEFKDNFVQVMWFLTQREGSVCLNLTSEVTL